MTNERAKNWKFVVRKEKKATTNPPLSRFSSPDLFTSSIWKTASSIGEGILGDDEESSATLPLYQTARFLLFQLLDDVDLGHRRPVISRPTCYRLTVIVDRSFYMSSDCPANV